MNIGQRIMELRKKQSMTQEQLADVLGTTRQAVSKWESGKSTPDIDIVIAMGNLFHVSMDYLLLGKEDGYDQAPPQSQHKTKLPWFSILLIIAGCYTLLLPLIAKLYHAFIRMTEGRYVTDYMFYLFRWPLISFVIIDIAMICVGGNAYLLEKRKNKQHSSGELGNNKEV